MPMMGTYKAEARVDGTGGCDVTRISSFTNKEHTLHLPCTIEELEAWVNGKSGLIQNAFPHFTPDQREFLLTGATAEEWEEAFPDEEGEGDDL